MKNRTLYLVALACLMFTACPALAENRVKVSFSSKIEPASAVGLILTNKGSREEKNVSIEHPGENSTVVSFPITEEEHAASALATAVIIDSKGNMIFSDMQKVTSPLSIRALAKTPLCEHQTITGAQNISNYPLLDQLVKVRTEMEEVARDNNRKMLEGPLGKKLSEIENQFGLQNSPALSADLEPLVLLDRLKRIRRAIDDYKAQKDYRILVEEGKR